ncbi:hypothetical protein Tco_0568927 [Tanacetum coccineum]
MFDESLSPPPNVDLQAPEVIAPIPEGVAPKHAVSTGSPSSLQLINAPSTMDTPMVEKPKLDKDKERKAVDPSHYRGMIGTLLDLTASRLDLQFAIYMCARKNLFLINKSGNAEFNAIPETMADEVDE